MKFPYMVPVDGGSYHVTDDAVIDFCLQGDVHSEEEGDAAGDGPFGKLEVYNGSFTKERRNKCLVEVSTRCYVCVQAMCPQLMKCFR